MTEVSKEFSMSLSPSLVFDFPNVAVRLPRLAQIGSDWIRSCEQGHCQPPGGRESGLSVARVWRGPTESDFSPLHVRKSEALRKTSPFRGFCVLDLPVQSLEKRRRQCGKVSVVCHGMAQGSSLKATDTAQYIPILLERKRLWTFLS